MRRTEILIATFALLIAAAGHAQAHVAFPLQLDQGTARLLLGVGASFAPVVAYLFRGDRIACVSLIAISALCVALVLGM